MKKFLLLLLILIGYQFSNTKCSAQSAGDYRTASNGMWDASNVWEKFDGTMWVLQASAIGPTASTAGVITVQHTIQVIFSVTVDQLIVTAAGDLTVSNTSIFTVTDGSGTDLSCSGNVNQIGTIEGTGLIEFQSGSTFHWMLGVMGGIGTTTFKTGSTAFLDSTSSQGSSTISWKSG